MRGQVECHLKQVERARNSFSSAEQRLQECQENLQRYKEKCAEQALTVRELQGQVSIVLTLEDVLKKHLTASFQQLRACMLVKHFIPSISLIQYFHADTLLFIFSISW